MLSLSFFSCAFLFATLIASATEPAISGAADSQDTQTNRVTVAWLGFENSANDSAMQTWCLGANELMLWQFEKLRAIQLRQDYDYACAELNLAALKIDNDQKLRKAGEFIRAKWLLRGGFVRQTNLWQAQVRLYETATGKQVTTLSASADNWAKATSDLLMALAKQFGKTPTTAEVEQIQVKHMVSDQALEIYGQALRFAGKPMAELEKKLHEAVDADPAFGEATLGLAVISGNAGRNDEAAGYYKRALALTPDSGEVHRCYGVFLDSLGKTAAAVSELEESVRLYPDDPETFRLLSIVYSRQGRLTDALAQCERSLDANPHSQLAGEVSNRLAELKQALTPTLFDLAQPRDYAESELTAELRKRLTPRELKLAINPLTGTPEMDKWARELTSGETNEMAKAQRLFEALAGYSLTHMHDESAPGELRNAREVFAAMNTPGQNFYCRDFSYLYLALARAAELRAYNATVQELSDGQMIPHACTAVFIDKRAMLVDVAVLRLGAAHKKFIILDDLQAIGVYLSEFFQMPCSEIAVKLAPEVPMVQINLCEKLVARAKVTEAREALANVRRLEPNPARVQYLGARIALLEGDTQKAIRLLTNAISITPYEAASQGCLAQAYAQAGNWGEAREWFRHSQKCVRTTQEAQLVSRYLANTNALEAYGRASRGIAFQIKGDLDRALKEYDHALALDPGCSIAYLFRRDARRSKGDLANAIADTVKIAQLYPDSKVENASWFGSVGRALYERGDYSGALACFRQAREVDKDDDYTPFQIWLARSRLGERSSANEELIKFLDSQRKDKLDLRPARIAGFLVGRVQEPEFLEAAKNEVRAEDQCDIWYYAACKHLIEGDRKTARVYFENCIGTKAVDCPECGSAETELKNLKSAK